jgi:lipopolysaccharide transport system permease protein
MATGLSSAPDYLARMYQLRYFGMSLVRADLHNRYRRSFFGIAWSLLRPLGMTVVLCVVFSALFNMPVRKYAPFLFLGIAIWQFILESVICGCSCFLSSSAYLRQQKVPLALFPLRTVLGSGIHAGIALLIAMLITCVFVGLPSLGVLLSVVPGLVLLFLLGVCFATVFGIMHTYFPDTQHCMEIVLQIVFYLTPVMYKPDAFEQHVVLSRWIEYNPLTSVIELIRRPMLTGEYPDLFNVGVGLVFLAVSATLAWWLLKKFERNLVFWV